ncbi:MAG: peptidase MA family metallohydrolase [Gemmatimonadota bacterium]
MGTRHELRDAQAPPGAALLGVLARALLGVMAGALLGVPWAFLGVPAAARIGGSELSSAGPLARSPAGALQGSHPPGPVRWHAGEDLARLAERIAADPAVWRPMPGIGPAVPGDDTVDVWLVRELAGLEGIGLGRSERWVAGVADPATGRIALRAGRELASVPDLRRVLRHELAHLSLHGATRGNYPRWLSEGYAQYAAGEWRRDEAWRLRFAFLRGGAESLRRISLRFQGSADEARLGYLLSYTAVHRLLEYGGEGGLRALFARLKEGDDIDRALRVVYGVTEEQFERAWRKRVLDRFGWLYVLSRASLFWLAIALFVMWLALRRARRDRDRLEELRATERFEAEADATQELEVEIGAVRAGVDPPRDAE